MQEWRTQHIAAIHMRTKNSGEGEQEQKDPGARTKVTPQATETGETLGPKQKYLRPLPRRDLFLLWASHQFHNGNRCSIAMTKSLFDNPQVSAMTIGIARPEFRKKLPQG